MASEQAPPGPRHSFEAHTGEVLLVVEAPDLPGLFAEAGRALAELMADEPPGPPDPGWETIALQARDREALLAAWLNELLSLGEIRHRLYAELEVERVSERELRARARGWAPDRIRTAVKAATYHRLSVRGAPGAYAATVVLDV